MTVGGSIGSRAIKGGGGEKLVQIMLHPYVSKIKKNNFHSPPSMSTSPPTISMLDKEDTCICKHEAVIERVKHAKEEWQRQ